MHSASNLMVAIGAVAAVLGLGLISMRRGRSPSQKRIRWRAGLQFAVIPIIITGGLWFRG